MTYLYKWMLPGLITPTQNKTWPVAVGEWTPETKPVLCQSGWHGMEEKDVLGYLPSRAGAELYLVEIKGTILTGEDKFAVESMRLVEKVGETTKENLRLFACDCAEDALSLIVNPDPRSVRAIEVARQYSHGLATDSELSAARSAAESAWSAARSAARSAAECAGYAESAESARSRYSNWLVVRVWEGR